MQRSYSLMTSVVVAMGNGERLAAALTRTPYLTTSAQEGAALEEQGFVGRAKCGGCFPMCLLATPPSTLEWGEAGRRGEGYDS
jgi:hypothetical protein